jgi:hypothetical protein
MLLNGMVWYGMVWYDMIWYMVYGIVLNVMVWYGIVLNGYGMGWDGIECYGIEF